jgi:hypothetical protein
MLTNPARAVETPTARPLFRVQSSRAVERSAPYTPWLS